MSTCPGISDPRSTADTLLLYELRTRIGRSVETDGRRHFVKNSKTNQYDRPEVYSKNQMARYRRPVPKLTMTGALSRMANAAR